MAPSPTFAEHLRLPNGPVEMITYDSAHKNLFAATDYGVFEHKDGDTTWYSLKGGLPNTPILDTLAIP